MNQLIAYLLEHLILDFDGDMTLDMVRDFLRDDNSREAKALLLRLVEDGGVDDMMICIADCLRDYLPKGVNADAISDQLKTYADS